MLFLGILDASPLFFPLGIDLLVVALAAHHHDRSLYYAGMAALGSVAGCFTTDWIGRAGGQAGLRKRLSQRRLRFIEKRVQARSGVALAIASVAPPGFPFTPVVFVAASLKYPRVRLLGIVAVFRFVRFSIEAMLAVRFGTRILRGAESPIAQSTILVVVVVSLVGSIWIISSWVRSSRGAPRA